MFMVNGVDKFKFGNDGKTRFGTIVSKPSGAGLGLNVTRVGDAGTWTKGDIFEVRLWVG